MRSAWLRRPALLASLTIIAVVVVANAIFIFGFASADPMLYFSGLGRPTQGVVDGSWTIDPNVGWTVQALGQRSVDSWLNGNVPLWNNYEGLGQPLAGEMQSAAFFLPFVLLQALPGGVLLMHIVLELVAGFGMLLFLRSLRLGWIAATAGACLFAVNGAFAVMLNAPFNPIAFLPWALWGVELVAAAVRGGGTGSAGSGRFGPSVRWGAWVIAFSIGFMLLSGFPETALLEGLFVAVWGIARVLTLQRARVRFLLWLVAGAAGSLVIAAPALVAFVHFLDFGYTAYHGAGTGPTSYGQRQMSSLALPFAVGPVSHNRSRAARPVSSPCPPCSSESSVSSADASGRCAGC